MGQVSVTLNGRTYRLSCEDGEQARLLALASHVRAHVDAMAREHGQIGEERLLLMAAILVADELFDLRERIAGGASPEPRFAAPVAPAAVPAPMSVPPVSVSAAAEPRPQIAAAQVVRPTSQPAEPAPLPPAVTAPVPPMPRPAPPAATVKPVELLDSTALMRGLDRKLAKG